MANPYYTEKYANLISQLKKGVKAVIVKNKTASKSLEELAKLDPTSNISVPTKEQLENKIIADLKKYIPKGFNENLKLQVGHWTYMQDVILSKFHDVVIKYVVKESAKNNITAKPIRKIKVIMNPKKEFAHLYKHDKNNLKEWIENFTKLYAQRDLKKLKNEDVLNKRISNLEKLLEYPMYKNEIQVKDGYKEDSEIRTMLKLNPEYLPNYEDVLKNPHHFDLTVLANITEFEYFKNGVATNKDNLIDSVSTRVKISYNRAWKLSRFIVGFEKEKAFDDSGALIKCSPAYFDKIIDWVKTKGDANIDIRGYDFKENHSISDEIIGSDFNALRITNDLLSNPKKTMPSTYKHTKPLLNGAWIDLSLHDFKAPIEVQVKTLSASALIDTNGPIGQNSKDYDPRRNLKKIKEEENYGLRNLVKYIQNELIMPSFSAIPYLQPKNERSYSFNGKTFITLDTSEDKK